MPVKLSRAETYRLARKADGHRDISDGARVSYMHPTKGAMFGIVPRENRCSGCRGWAVARFRTGTSVYCKGWLACLDCISFWRRLGRSGFVKMMVAA